MSNGTFDFNQFIKDSKDTLINPKSYFSTMKTSGGIAEPLIKAVIYGVIAGIFYLLWGLLKVGGATGSILGGTIGFMAFIWAIIAAVIGLFIGAVILLIISSVCKGNTDYEANARVTASLMVMMPINALLSFTVGINTWLGLIIRLAVNLYMIWLLYHGLVQALKAKPETAKIVLYVLVGLIVLFMLLGIGARNKANRFLNEYNKDAKELLKDLQNN